MTDLERVSAATQAYQSMCSLVNEQGACRQCSELRILAEPRRQGAPLESIGLPGDLPEARFRARLQIVRQADLSGGRSRSLHNVLLRGMTRIEETRFR